MQTRFFLSVLFLLALAAFCWASEVADVAQHPSCSYCGMDRAKFSQSRVVIRYDDGTSIGACSLHCAAIDLATRIDKGPRFIGVGDYGSKKLINAEKAHWVLVADHPGVMTSHAKWAFEDKKDADAFIQANGGVLVTFDQAITAAFNDMWKDTKQIRERRKLKRMQLQKGAS